MRSRVVNYAIASLFAFGSTQSLVFPANIGFMPGDAFFRSDVDLEAEKFPVTKDNQLELKYENDFEYASFGGYAGFYSMQIKNVGPDLKKNLETVWNRFRGEKSKESDVACHLLVYGRDVDLSKIRVGIRYNEDWRRYPDSARRNQEQRFVFEHGLYADGKYQPVFYSLREADCVIEDWKNCETIKGLQAKTPEGIAWGLFEKEINDPIEIEGKNIKFVIIKKNDMLDVFHGKEGATFFIVSSESIIMANYGKKRLGFKNIVD